MQDACKTCLHHTGDSTDAHVKHAKYLTHVQSHTHRPVSLWSCVCNHKWVTSDTDKPLYGPQGCIITFIFPSLFLYSSAPPPSIPCPCVRLVESGMWSITWKTQKKNPSIWKSCIKPWHHIFLLLLFLSVFYLWLISSANTFTLLTQWTTYRSEWHLSSLFLSFWNNTAQWSSWLMNNYIFIIVNQLTPPTALCLCVCVCACGTYLPRTQQSRQCVWHVPDPQKSPQPQSPLSWVTNTLKEKWCRELTDGIWGIFSKVIYANEAPCWQR